MTDFKELFEVLKFDDLKIDTDLKNDYYSLADAVWGMEDNLDSGNYKEMSKEYQKVIKAFKAFEKRYELNKF